MGRTYWESGQHDEVKGASPLLMFNLPLAKNADKNQIITQSFTAQHLAFLRQERR